MSGYIHSSFDQLGWFFKFQAARIVPTIRYIGSSKEVHYKRHTLAFSWCIQVEKGKNKE